MLKYLSLESINIKNILDLIEERDIPEAWKIVVLVFKEQELKIKGRLFCKMVFEMRLWQVATEKNLGKTLLPYIKYQTMTYSNDQLTRKLLRLAKATTSKNFIMATIDFSSWNLRFRYESMQVMCETMDNWYGLNGVYSFTHIFPTMSRFLGKTNLHSPALDGEYPGSSVGSFYSFEAFSEGMRQKLWTLFTVSLVMGIGRSRHMDVDMIAQGDNMQIIIRVSNSDLSRKFYYAEEFLKEISEKSETVGIPIKLSESWISTKIIEYSRIYFFSGYECPSDLKKMSRLDSATPDPVDEFREHF